MQDTEYLYTSVLGWLEKSTVESLLNTLIVYNQVQLVYNQYTL